MEGDGVDNSPASPPTGGILPKESETGFDSADGLKDKVVS